MTQGEDKLAAFEARLNEIRRKTEAGLAARADALESAAERHHQGDPTALEEIRRVAHKIRGVATGRDRLRALAEHVELAAKKGELSDLDDLLKEARAIAESAAVPSPAVPAVPSPAEPSEAAEKSKGRILVVDDDAAILRMMGMSLRRLGGFDVTTVSTRDEAMAALDELAFDVVLLDAMMPNTTGLELCAHARSTGLQDHARIVILSAATREQLGWEDDSDGPDAWWHKPLLPKDAVSRIRALLEDPGT